MKATGVFATKKEHNALVKKAQEARRAPMMLVGGTNISRSAMHSVLMECHSLALKHGLPEFDGHYGISEDGEFLAQHGR